MRNNQQRGVKVLSPAKINTFLHVYQPRKDGYHDLFTHFQLVGLFDEITFVVNETGVIRVTNPVIAIEMKKDLCYRAAEILQKESGCKLGVDISVKKNIPDGGGLGGGSSNAATVLVVLNKLWDLALPEDTLLQMGLSLGSDVPVFIHGKTTLAQGRGEKFIRSKFSDIFENKSIIIIKPKVHAATAKIFQSQWLTKRSDTGKIRHLDTARLIRSGENDFESVVFKLYPSISQAASRLSDYSPAHLTGTGACLYTVLDDVKKADKIIRALGGDYDAFCAKALNTSPLNEFK